MFTEEEIRIINNLDISQEDMALTYIHLSKRPTMLLYIKGIKAYYGVYIDDVAQIEWWKKHTNSYFTGLVLFKLK